MRFRQHQDQARAATRRLLWLFLLTVVLTVTAFNGVLALLWMLHTGGLFGFPRWFFETNTVVSAGFILGGSWLESVQLRQGGAHVAQMVGGHELLVASDEPERRLRNIVQEMAIASGLRPPRVFVLPRDDSINAFAAGWEQQDSVIALTRGALERLARDELQGVVAHEISHILHGDARLNMRLIGHVWGLQLLYMLGRDLTDSSDRQHRRPLLVLLGLGVMAVGSIGWLAGRLLKAAVSRQREFLADAAAVQYTRLPSGIGGALRKVAGQQVGNQGRLLGVRAEVISHMLLASDIFIQGGALATHPPLAERIRRIYGRPMPPLPSAVLAMPQELLAKEAAIDYGVVAFSAAAAIGPPTVVGSAIAPEPACASECAPGYAPAQEEQGPTNWPNELLEIAWPPDLAPATLVYMTGAGPGAGATRQAWRMLFPELDRQRQDRLLQQVRTQPPAAHQGAFERLLTRCAALTLAQRRALRQQAQHIVQADGHVSLSERLRCLLLDHVLDLQHESVLRETHCLSLAQCGDSIDSVGLALAGQLLQGEPGGAQARAAWCRAVRRTLELGPAPADAGAATASIEDALLRLPRLAAMSRPRLMKAWCAQALDGAQAVPQDALDALRCLCLLIDTPIPQSLAAHFPDLARARA